MRSNQKRQGMQFKKTKRAARAKSTQARASTPLAAFDRVRISPLQYSDLPACDCFATSKERILRWIGATDEAAIPPEVLQWGWAARRAKGAFQGGFGLLWLGYTKEKFSQTKEKFSPRRAALLCGVLLWDCRGLILLQFYYKLVKNILQLYAIIKEMRSNQGFRFHWMRYIDEPVCGDKTCGIIGAESGGFGS